MKLELIRKEYRLKELDELQVDIEPVRQFEKWMNEALSSDVNEPTAMVVSTVSAEGFPSSRIVLLKGITQKGFVFFTNYLSRKGEEIATNPRVALLFHWPELERQVRIEGIASKSTAEQSATYFGLRPLESRISAVVSPQSKRVADRRFLEKKWNELQKSIEAEGLSCPDYWGGYVVDPYRFEFWQGRPNRLHDRIVYQKVDFDSNSLNMDESGANHKDSTTMSVPQGHEEDHPIGSNRMDSLWSIVRLAP